MIHVLFPLHVVLSVVLLVHVFLSCPELAGGLINRECRLDEPSPPHRRRLASSPRPPVVRCIYMNFCSLKRDETGNIEPQVELNDALVFGEGSEESLPEHIYDVDRVLAKTPLLRKDNAFHDTLNGEGARIQKKQG